MIKNYIFDFGNVLSRYYPDELTASCTDNPEDIRLISDIVFDRLYWDRLDSGDISDSEVKKCICSRLPEDKHSLACKVYDSWVANMTPVEGMQQLISDIRNTDKKLYLLSNISQGFANTYADVPWLKELLGKFDGLVLSGTLGMVKPHKEIFEHLLNKYGLNADECLFVDDSPKNIAGAESVGIKGYLFDGDANKLRRYLGL